MSSSDSDMISRMIGHAMLVLFIGLIAGVCLVFSLLGEVRLWPLPGIDWEIGGSVRGWQAAHVGGILNGVMIGALALLVHHLQVTKDEFTGRDFTWTSWGLIIAGWGNTVFYWAGNFSQNRGLAVDTTAYGAGDLFGAASYLGGAVAMLTTFVAVYCIARAAFSSR